MREYKVNGSEGARVSGLGHEVLKKNRNFYIGVAGTVLEGMLSGSLFMLLYAVMQFLWAGRFDMNRALLLTGLIAGIFLLRMPDLQLWLHQGPDRRRGGQQKHPPLHG